MVSPTPKDVARLIAAAGGEIVGRTRLQKVGCILELAGADFGFDYSYHLYGPYSEQLSLAVTDAEALGLISSEERTAEWGGRYSIYSSKNQAVDIPQPVLKLAQTAAKADSVVLELAVTAAYLASIGVENPWEEVSERKKVKASPERIKNAKDLYHAFLIGGLPKSLPELSEG